MNDLQSMARLASVVYREPPDDDDPAELYHEASKLAPATAARQVAGATRLAALPELRQVTARAGFRHGGPLLALPEADRLELALGTAIRRRRSARAFSDAPIRGETLAAVLEAAYGVTGRLEHDGDWEQPLRAAPSGGALYPLDLYVAVARVEGLDAGLYRYDPLASGLESLGAAAGVADATAYPALATRAAATVVLVATFWRSRFKYGLRAYRFALLECGHTAQNLLLAATALGLGAVPLGGFFDHRLDTALGLDGVNRSSLYVVCVGAPEARC